MQLSDLSVCTGVEFHDKYDPNHICREDGTVYYLIDGANWLTICQDDEDDLWRGEWEFEGKWLFDDYEGRAEPEDVLTMLTLKAQAMVAESVIDEL